MVDLLYEVARFKEWTRARPPNSLNGEWESDYDHWPALHAAVLRFLDSEPIEAWSHEAVDAVLYAIARDNEVEHLAREIADAHRALLTPLARLALVNGEPDARWQFAVQLGRVGQNAEIDAEEILLLMLQDEQEYVRRRALGSLARIGSSHTEPAAEREWRRVDPNQEWARMMCLWSLHRIGSPRLRGFLDDAERDTREHLRSYAQRVRSGDVDL